ncbi:hypothetical protein IM697_35750 [Streptomyces ferrugineus]|uniref:Uncharacterized protein n=1 Tax=Streptomyces ferrugineus TaxID=1413221 RepID=A0A7M2SJJ7_9ACTN|nr:hypothetical protein [Streptomyces ferrugineus]QOV35371.1 hypothetical protein IM697_35750 [Streptomyces ferrugineus]
MYDYAFHHIRSADLIRQAEHERLVREAVRVRRAARRERSAEGTEDAPAQRSRLRRNRHPRAA